MKGSELSSEPFLLKYPVKAFREFLRVKRGNPTFNYSIIL